jgi:hypothetical protein
LNSINPPHPHVPSNKPTPANEAGAKYLGVVAARCKSQRF